MYRSVLIRFVCLVLVIATSTVAYTDEQAVGYDAEISAWLDFVMKHGNLAGVETSGAEFEALKVAGPNVLPDLMRALGSTQDYRLQFALTQAISVITGIKIYQFREDPPPQYENPTFIPDATAASLVYHGQDQVGTIENLAECSRLLTSWWGPASRNRAKRTVNTFLNELDIRRKEESGFMVKPLLQRSLGREGKFILSYGIYGLPEIIRSVGETNSPEVFCIFLNSSRNVRNDYTLYYESEGALWPSTKEKIEYIRTWWTRERPRYTRLDDLAGEIDKAVEALSKE